MNAVRITGIILIVIGLAGFFTGGLPMHFRDYQAVLLDTKNNTLVFVPQGGSGWLGVYSGRVAKIVLRPNVNTKAGLAASVVSLGSSPRGDLLKSGQYKLLIGKL